MRGPRFGISGAPIQSTLEAMYSAAVEVRVATLRVSLDVLVAEGKLPAVHAHAMARFRVGYGGASCGQVSGRKKPTS